MQNTGTPIRPVRQIPSLLAAFAGNICSKLGGFDESLLTNEDYELNTRIRQAGGKLWLDPNIQVQYYSRSNLRQLARQYIRYGYWKLVMLRRYPDSVRWRQALPPLFVLGLIVLGIASIWMPAARWLLFSVLVIYMAALTLSGIDVALQAKRPALIFGVPLVIAVMHLSWGSAFLVSAIKSLFQRRKEKPGRIGELMSKQTKPSWQLRPGERRLLIIVGDILFSWIAFVIAVYVWAVAQVQFIPLMDFIQSKLAELVLPAADCLDHPAGRQL